MKQKLQMIYDKYKDAFSGALLAKTDDQVLLSAANGYANRDFCVPNQKDTKFDVASVTKTFTAVAVLKLVSEGVLRLEDHITDLVDLNGTKISEDVTVEMLLNHTSGIADDADEEAGELYEALFVDKPNYAFRDCADILPNFAYKEPNFAPGTGVRYNNCAFVLLGLAIENKTGQNYRSYVRENILVPGGLTNTAFLAKDEVCPNAAEGYFPIYDEEKNIVKWKKNIYSYPPIGTPDGGIYTTVEDLDRFLRLILAGELLPVEYTKMLLTPHCAFTRPNRHGTWRTGYAFEFIERDKEIFCLYKEGGNLGVDAIFAYFPGHDLTLSIVANQNDTIWELYNELKDAIAEEK